MKNSKLLATLGILLTLVSVYASAGKLQNSDFATPTQITNAGGNISQLLNDSNIYVTSLGVSLSAAIASGSLGGTLLDTTFAVHNSVDLTKQFKVSLTGQGTMTGSTLVYQGSQNRYYTFPDDSGNIVLDGTPQTLVQKTINADQNYISNIRNANVAVDAGIDHSKIAGGNTNALPTWDANGVLSAGMPNMLINVEFGDYGFNSFQAKNVPVDGQNAGGRNSQSFGLDVNPVNPNTDSNQSNVALTMHHDRPGSGQPYAGQEIQLNMNMTHEGTSSLGSQLMMTSNQFVGGFGRAGASVGNAALMSSTFTVGDQATVGSYTGTQNSVTVNPSGVLSGMTVDSFDVQGDINGSVQGRRTFFGNGTITGGFTGSEINTSDKVTGNYKGSVVSHHGDYLGGLDLFFGAVSGNGIGSGSTGLHLSLGDQTEPIRQGASIGMGGGHITSNSNAFVSDFQNVNVDGSKAGILLGGGSGTSGQEQGVLVVQGSGNTGDFTGVQISGSTANAGNSWNGLSVNDQVGLTQNETGLQINLGNQQVLNNLGRAKAISAAGGTTSTQVFVTTTPGLFVDTVNLAFTGLNVTPSKAISGTDVIMNTYSSQLNAGDDVVLGPLGAGITSMGFVFSTGVALNHNVDQVAGALGGIAMSSIGFDGGTITNGAAFRSIGAIPFGGTTTVTNFASFEASATSCSGGIAANCWGDRVLDTNANNYFAGNVVIGGATGLPTSASVGLEMQGTTKVIVATNLTAGQEAAIVAPKNGSIDYNSTLGKMQCYQAGAWQDCAPSGSGTGTMINIVADPTIGGVTSGGFQMLSSPVGVTLTAVQGIPPYLVRDTVNFVGVASSDDLGTANLVSRNAAGQIQAKIHNSLIENQTSLDVAQGTALISTATALMSTGTIVSRNGLGDFSARIITADLIGNVTGSASTLTSILDVAHGGTGGNTTETAMGTLLPLNQKGDLLVYTGLAGAPFDRLPVGTAGQVLTAAPVTSTAGIQWQAPAGGGGGSAQVSEYAIFGAPGTTFGSTNTAVFRFNDTAVTINTGGGVDFQCQDDALLGFYCNILKDGVYWVSAMVLRTDDDGYISVSAGNAGIQYGTTGVGTFTTLAQKTTIRDLQRGIRAAGAPQEVSGSVILKAGDTVWCGGDGAGTYSSDYTTWRFHITKVGN